MDLEKHKIGLVGPLLIKKWGHTIPLLDIAGLELTDEGTIKRIYYKDEFNNESIFSEDKEEVIKKGVNFSLGCSLPDLNEIKNCLED